MPGRSVTSVSGWSLMAPSLAVHRHAGEIAHVLVGAGELVEQGGLAAVLVARQCKGQGLAVGQGTLALFGVVAAAFAQARVLHHLLRRAGLGGQRAPWGWRRPSICAASSSRRVSAVAVDLQLHGVAHGRKLHQRHLFPGNQPHIQKMLPQGSRPANGLHYGAFADVQFFECHVFRLSSQQLLACINNGNID